MPAAPAAPSFRLSARPEILMAPASAEETVPVVLNSVGKVSALMERQTRLLMPLLRV